MATVWNDELKPFVKNLWEHGVSAANIVYELYTSKGITTTRNAVLGLADRNEWKTPTQKSQRTDIKVKQEQLLMSNETPADFLGLTIYELTATTCRFPRGDDPVLFCGQPSMDGSPYCAACHRLAHVAQQTRRGPMQWQNKLLQTL